MNKLENIYKGNLFSAAGGIKNNIKNVKKREIDIDIEKLIDKHAEVLMNKYNTACLDVKQLQQALNVGESNIYEMLKKGELPCRIIGKRKMVPVIALATYLIIGTNIEK